MIELQGITHRYGDRFALDGIDLRVAEGEKLVLLGANGTGKTTLLKLLAGLITPVRGSYRYCGEPIDAARLKRDAALARRFRREVG
ncbi:MAG: ATP-binding cassette domain-containing protein, partial [Burkholderiaceae bacterium]|nr:ATP-binding cassette domain-containing protein [Burkholderiaceae bacterium]